MRKLEIVPAEPVDAEPAPHLWTLGEAAKAMRVSVRYLQASDCPVVLLPSNKPGGRPIRRLDPGVCRRWWRKHLNREESAA